MTKVWNVCSKSLRKTAEWRRNCTFCCNLASICLPHFDWTLAQTSNCRPVGSAWPRWGTKVLTFGNCTTVEQILWRRERISAECGCYLTKPRSGIWSLNWNLSPVSGEAKVTRNRKSSRGPSRTWNKWWVSCTIVQVWSWECTEW